MKKTLLFVFSALSITAFSQTLTQANHAPMVGDPNYSTNNCDATNINPGAAGANQTWNYTISTLTNLSNYTVSANSNVVFNPATVAVSSATNNTSYYLPSATELKNYGGNLSIQSNNFNVQFTAPAITAIYPMSLNTSTTSITAGNVVVSGFPGTFTGICDVKADATGTLVLSGKTFTNVIRVNTTQHINATASIGITATITSVNYDYYAVGISKAPILSISSSTFASSVGTPSTDKTVKILSNYLTVGIHENQKSSIDLSVFPNPTNGIIHFATTSTEATKIIAYDITGKLVATQFMEIGKATLNLSHLNSGVYFYQVVDKNNVILKSDKFNVID